MAIKYVEQHFHSKALQNIATLGFLVCKYTYHLATLYGRLVEKAKKEIVCVCGCRRELWVMKGYFWGSQGFESGIIYQCHRMNRYTADFMYSLSTEKIVARKPAAGLSSPSWRFAFNLVNPADML
jgi:hypothetical protein